VTVNSKKVGPVIVKLEEELWAVVVKNGQCVLEIDVSAGDWQLVDIYSASTHWCLGPGGWEQYGDWRCNTMQMVGVVEYI